MQDIFFDIINMATSTRQSAQDAQASEALFMAVQKLLVNVTKFTGQEVDREARLDALLSDIADKIPPGKAALANAMHSSIDSS